MMDDLDPAAPSQGELEEHAREVTNFGIDLEGDFPPGDAGLDLPKSFATFTINFKIDQALAFLQACETSHPRITYGLGKRIKPGQVPGRDFTQVDCSGIFPDGSVVQHDWVRKKGFAADTVASGAQQDGAVRIAFLSPSATTSGIG